MIVGLFLHIWSATPHVGQMGTWDDDSKVRTSTIYSLLRPTVRVKGRLEGCEYERDGVMEQEILSLSGHWRAMLILCVMIGRGYVHGRRTGRYLAVLCRSSCVIFAYSQVIRQLSLGPRFRLATAYGFCFPKSLKACLLLSSISTATSKSNSDIELSPESASTATSVSSCRSITVHQSCPNGLGLYIEKHSTRTSCPSFLSTFLSFTIISSENVSLGGSTQSAKS